MKQLICLFSLLMTMSCSLIAAELVVVVNKANGISEISKSDLVAIYTKKMTKWSEGDEKIKPVMLKKGAVRDTFIKSYLDMTPSSFKSFWQKMVFTGKGTPPKGLSEDSDIISYVKDNEGAIGFVAKGTATEGVKAVTVK